MNVVHIVRQYTPSIGGMEEVVRNLAAHQLNNSPYTPSIITLNKVFRDSEKILSNRDNIEGVEVTRLNYAGSERFPLCPQVLKYITHADLVHVHGIDFFFDYLALTKHIHKKPLIASTHGGFFHTSFASSLKKIYFKTITRITVKSYRNIICTSNNDHDIFSIICKNNKTQVIENGVDIEKFNNCCAPNVTPTLIYFGRWSSNKGIYETLQLFSSIVKKSHDIPWRLIVAGRDYDLDEKSIKQHAVNLQVADKVDVYCNPSNSHLRNLIQNASYFICLSKHEGFGIAPIEAMSAGLFPILSSIPPFQSLVKATGLGMILDDQNIIENANNIIDDFKGMTIKTESEGTKRREECIKASLAYSWNSSAQQYIDAYDTSLRVTDL